MPATIAERFKSKRLDAWQVPYEEGGHTEERILAAYGGCQVAGNSRHGAHRADGSARRGSPSSPR